MGANSKIQWTDHTFNPWMGCTKASPGCKHCYAERDMDHRYHKVKWGPQGTRIRTSEDYWKQPLKKWEKQPWVECTVCGWRGVYDGEGVCPGCEHPMVRVMKTARARVFCASLADVFEDNDQVKGWREELFDLIEKTPNLDWLLLTKRPENVVRLLNNFTVGDQLFMLLKNVWIGTSVENQKMADERIPALLEIPAKIRFLSCEPLLEEVDLHLHYLMVPDGYPNDREEFNYRFEYIHWVIAGGESGPDARPMDPDWVRSLREQCQAAGTPYYFKQWGEWAPISHLDWLNEKSTLKYKPISLGGENVARVGIGLAGHKLDGVEWRQMPKQEL